MIFDTNSTSLNGYEPNIIEGYEEPADFARVMYENALNDEAMFKAMLAVDAKEIAIKRESADADLAAFTEATLSGIWERVSAIWEKFCDKVASIFRSIITKFNVLAMDGEKLVKKYSAVVNSALSDDAKCERIKNITFKWYPNNKDMAGLSDAQQFDIGQQIGAKFVQSPNIDDMADACGEDDAATWANLFGPDIHSAADIIPAFHKTLYGGDKKVEMKLGDRYGDAQTCVSQCKGSLMNSKNMAKALNTNMNTLIKASKKFASDCKKHAKEVKNSDSAESEKASKAYKASSIYASGQMQYQRFASNQLLADYKIAKGVWGKMVLIAKGKAASEGDQADADAVAEAAEEEVDDVIVGATKGDAEGIVDLSLADTKLTDKDVSDDPNKLTYDDTDCYTAHEYPEGGKDGEIDVTINARESATSFYGELLY